MSLSGRCACGLRVDLAALEPDDHLPCNGLKRCRRCQHVRSRDKDFRRGGLGGVNGTCRECERIQHREEKRQRWAVDPEYRRKQIWYSKLYRTFGPITGKRKPQIQRPQPMFRTCKTCQVTKPIADFYEPSKLRRRGRCYPCYRSRENEIRKTRRKYDQEYVKRASAQKRVWRERRKLAA